MTTPRRLDGPGDYHHVMNRGVAHRSIYEQDADYRFFLSRCAKAARLGLIELLAFALLANHFHLLVKSLLGRLSDAMAMIEQPYAARFNRIRGRDGPLFRGRFRSRRIEDDTYLRAVLAYVELNPVAARLATHPSRYRWCSAGVRARRPTPKWLANEAELPFSPGGAELPCDHAAWVIERRLATGGRGNETPLGELLDGSSARASAWLARRALLADGVHSTAAVAAPITVERAISSEIPPAVATLPRCRVCDPLAPTRVGLLRAACGLTWSEIAAVVQLPRTTCGDLARAHAERATANVTYRKWCEHLLRRAIRESFPERAPPPTVELAP